ncbi:hypothetical protein [Pseudomonas sp. CCI2.4]|uniref:hypothetical protein n=1 Tax=Pseudomonas sp. CCI2.4 TaxID=3048617 RepID=UPI002B225C3D|nr:hypothetical protein [Pseudomonas sp. CCI2.4]MEB0133564.1 hypothetical protein [Pseudomonas sp. CCI2.4]
MRVAIIGGNSREEVAQLMSCLNQARDVMIGPAIQIKLAAYDNCVQLRILAVEGEDPFKGGGRSKGEKKRAARKRRVKGGY